MDHHRIYLSGPISHFTWAQATQWRFDLYEELSEYAEVLDPMRDVEPPEDPNTLVTEAMGSIDPVMMTDRGIVTRDYHDTITATILIVNLLGAQKASVGTIAEISWAWHLKIPTIVIMENDDNPHEHPFIREQTSFRVNTVHRAIAVAKSIMGVPQSW